MPRLDGFGTGTRATPGVLVPTVSTDTPREDAAEFGLFGGRPRRFGAGGASVGGAANDKEGSFGSMTVDGPELAEKESGKREGSMGG